MADASDSNEEGAVDGNPGDLAIRAAATENGKPLALASLVLKKKKKAAECMDAKDYAGAVGKYSDALAVLAESRMLLLGMPEEDWERFRETAQSACGPGEPWYFRVLWGAMTQSGACKDEEAAKLFSNMSLCHGRLDEWPKAQGDANAALALWPDWTKARYRLSEAMSNLGEHHTALIEACKARTGSAPSEVKEITALLARLLTRAMTAAGTKLASFDDLDVEQAEAQQVQQYKTIAMLERDVFHATPGWSEGIEAKASPSLFSTLEGTWDVDRPQPVRFKDYWLHLSKTDSRFAEDPLWQSWAKHTSQQIREGLDKLLPA